MRFSFLTLYVRSVLQTDLPLTTFQAYLNEALVTVYAGFHPDSWWVVDTETNDGEQENGAALHPIKKRFIH